jgi:KDO2-lipid IV(A) lauroyltransferase
MRPPVARTARRAAASGVEFAAYAAVRAVVAVVQILPTDMGDRICRHLAWLAGEVLGIRRGTADENISRVFAGQDAAGRHRLTAAMWHHLLLMVCEIAWAQRRLHRCNWHRHVRFRGNREMLERLLSPRPAVIVTGHFGNFELGGYVTGLMGIDTVTIARRLDNRFLHAWVERFRQAKGQRMVDKEGCAPLVDRHLRGGGTLSILADQHAGPKGCWVDFLGRPASCHKALALFTLSSEAPMLVAYTRRVGGRPMQFETGCVGIADPRADTPGHCGSVTALTRWYNQRLAEAIGLSVEQYWWLHRRWRQPPPRVAKRLARNAA